MSTYTLFTVTCRQVVVSEAQVLFGQDRTGTSTGPEPVTSKSKGGDGLIDPPERENAALLISQCGPASPETAARPMDEPEFSEILADADGGPGQMPVDHAAAVPASSEYKNIFMITKEGMYSLRPSLGTFDPERDMVCKKGTCT